MIIQYRHQFGKVGDGEGETIDLVDNDDIDSFRSPAAINRLSPGRSILLYV